MKKVYKACVPSGEFTPKGTDETKQKWTQVGAGFANDNGSISIKIDKNISVSNELVLFLPKKGDKKDG